MAKSNFTSGKVTTDEAAADSREVALSVIMDGLDLPNDGQQLPAIVEPEARDPYTTSLDVTPTVGQIAMEAEADTAEVSAAKEEQQKDIEASQALQQLHGTSLGDFGPKDIYNIAGPDAAPYLIWAVKRLQRTDSLSIPFDEAKKMESVKSMMGVESAPAQDVSALDDELDMRVYVDKEHKKPLNSAELFGHMNAVRFTGDSRVMEVLPDLQILGMTLMESILSKQTEDESMIPQDLIDNFSKDDISDIAGLSPTDLQSGVSEAQIGRTLSQEWLKLQQVRDQGMDTVPDAHLDPTNELTKEAYEKLGMWAKQIYSLGNPMMYQSVQVQTGNGKTRGEYLITPLGRKMLENTKKDLMPPKVYARPQVTNDPKPTTKYSKTKEKTGKHYEDPKQRGKRTPEVEVRENVSKVRHVISAARLKSGLFMSLMGMKAAAEMTMTDGVIKVKGKAAEMLGIGQKAADKINNASRNAIYRADILMLEASGLNPNHPKVAQLTEKAEILRSFAAEAATPSWKKRMYERKAAQALEMLQDIAEFRNDPISFTNYIQTGTSRLGYSAQKMNMQTHKLARQLYGSGTQYQIKPGSNSNAEYAMIVTWGSHLFAEHNLVPEQMIRNMRKRIAMKDDKLMSIASVGRKLKGILDNYNVDATANALLQMEQADNQIKGVGGVMATVGEFQADSEVTRFMEEAFEHPNETINLIEEAIELGRYMDAVERGGSFASSMRPVEVDGISNGLASMTTQLGLTDVMYRIGVLRQDPSKVLAMYDGVEGNLRAVLADSMNKTLPHLVDSMEFRNEFGMTIEDLPQIEDILALAIAQSDEFLKPPLMTLPYGQSIKSMLSAMMNTVTASKGLTDMAADMDGGVPKMSRMLHVILAHNLEETLGSAVNTFSKSLKGVTDLAMLADEPLRFKKPTGTWTSINTVDYVPQDGAPVISQIREKYVKPVGEYVYGDPSKANPSVLGNTRITRNKYQASSAELGALGKTADGGYKASQSILPQAIISNDGAAIANALSGVNYRNLQRDSGSETPYVTTIYDAIIGDLGSFKPLVDTVNKAWVDVTLKYDLMTEMAEGANNAYKRGATKLNTMAKQDPKGLVSNAAQAQFMIEKSYWLLPRNGSTDPLSSEQKMVLSILRDTTDRFEALSKKEKRNLPTQGHMVTNLQARELFKVLTPSMKYSLQSMYNVANEAKDRRAKLSKILGNNPVFQYHMDALKSFDFN